MSEVFLSYRQTGEDQKRRVGAFGERLRDSGITVILDQFFFGFRTLSKLWDISTRLVHSQATAGRSLNA